MYQAIVVTYRGPTNAQGARLQCKASAGTKYYPWDYALNPEANYVNAARAFAVHFTWAGTYVGGTLPNGDKVFVTTRDTSHDAFVFTAPS